MPRDSYRRDRDYSYDRDAERERDRRRESKDRIRDSDAERERERRRQRRRRERDYPSGYESNGREYDTDRSQQRHRHRSSDRSREHRRRRGHRATDSTGELLPRPERSYDPPYHDPSSSPTKSRHARGESGSRSRPSRSRKSEATGSSGGALLADSLAQLNKQNEKKGWRRYDDEYLKEVQEKEREMERARRREEKDAERERRREARRAREADKERRREERRTMEYEMEKRRRYEEQMGFSANRATRDPELEDELLDDELVYNEEVEGRFRRDRYLESPRKHRRSEYMDSPERPIRGEYMGSPGRRIDYTDSEIDEVEEEKRIRRKEKALAGGIIGGKGKRRVISGPLLEKGHEEEYEHRVAEHRGGAGSEPSYYDDTELKKKKRKRWIIIGIVVVVVLAIVIPVAIVESRKNSNNSAAAAQTSGPANSNLDGMSEDDIPSYARGGLLDPFTWYDTLDFNVTFTNDTVGGLSVMGLNSTWDDSVRANDNVPALDETFEYGNMSIRGVNIGGWLNIEPFITPSFFESYSTSEGIIDEWTLTTKLGSSKAASTLEEHYSSWATRQTFEDIRAAGFDHVRIPFGYWAVTTYDDDPYVAKISWRYLLRGIEYARQNGLRVNLDLHGLPGSQNGWNHSGRQGVIGWLNGTDGELNGQRSLGIHNQLSTFFAQERYKNVVTMYGLCNEPRMVALDTQSVLDWYDQAIPIIRDNGITGILVFGDGFMGLDNWQGKLQNYTDLLLDVHQYVIFNVEQIVLDHSEKLNFACKGWTQQSLRSMNTSTGFGPTMCGEWSQADADCAQYINNVGWGTRWEGTYDTGNDSTNVLTPTCPLQNSTCSCDNANADASEYSDAYKEWLLDFALGQMYSFEQGWGWFYWTWKTEKATQWSYEAGMAAGILPSKVWDRSFSCNTSDIPDFASMGLPEYY